MRFQYRKVYSCQYTDDYSRLARVFMGVVRCASHSPDETGARVYFVKARRKPACRA